MIELRHLSKRFTAGARDVHALDDVSLTVEAGRIHGLIGSSGAGKSTLLRCINLLERPDSGEVIVDGTDMLGLGRAELSAQRRGIGMIFQQFNLLDSKTVFDNIAMPMRLAGADEAAVKARVDELLGFVELTDKAGAYPPRLSGGQKQRVGIARALANAPRILLCDEATSALDPETTDSILDLLRRVNRELGVTIVVVTHEMQVIAKVCHRVAVMSHGRIVEEGPVIDIFAAPQQPITRRFVRTIIDDRIPASLVGTVQGTRENHAVWRLTGRGEQAAAGVLSDVTADGGVRTRLLYASMLEIDATVLSVLIVQALGQPENLDQARSRIEASGLRVDPHDVSDQADAGAVSEDDPGAEGQPASDPREPHLIVTPEGGVL